MSTTVRAKRDFVIDSMCYGDQSGMSVKTPVSVQTKWVAKKKDGYWWLSHKGVRLRLTECAMSKLFEEVPSACIP